MKNKIYLVLLACIFGLLYVVLPDVSKSKQYDCYLVEQECNDSYTTYDDYEYNLYHLNCVLNSECGVCSEEEKWMVASVVFNRWKDPTEHIISVISEPGQFDGYNDINYFPVDSCIVICEDVLAGHGYDSILYFYNPVISTDSTFLAWANTQDLTKHEYHNYF